MFKKTVAFIGGGNMAEGIIRGMLNTKTIAPENVKVSEIIPKRRKFLTDTYGIDTSGEAKEFIGEADIIFLAVRPQDAYAVAMQMKDGIRNEQILISICAGIDISKLEEWFGEDKKVARVMPNTMIEARHGYSGVCTTDNITQEDRDTITEMFHAIGQTMFIPEALFNAFTAYSCAGPAYVLYFIAGMVDAGVESGFSRKNAASITLQNLIGAAKNIELTGKHPYQLTDRMTSPAGVTIEGLHVLSRTGFHGIVMDSVRRALNRTDELG